MVNPLRLALTLGSLGMIGIGIYLIVKTTSTGTHSPPPDVFAGEHIPFKKSILFSADGMTIDGEEPVLLPCAPEPKRVGLLRVDADTMAEITCSLGYLGGVKLIFNGPTGQSESLDIAQQDGDAGDQWDARSLVSRGRDGRLLVETIVLLSTNNLESPKQPASCTLTESAHVWSPESRAFVPYKEDGEFYLSQFTPPINVVNDCLDSHGTWRGRGK